MNIVVAVKVVPDDEDIKVDGDRKLDYSNASPRVNAYDLNAIEAAARLASECQARLYAVVVGTPSSLDGKVTKNILARGVDELVVAADDGFAGLDAHATAQALSAAIGKVGEVDLVICGDGSADLYAQQVDVQVAVALGFPVVTSVGALAMEDGKFVAERLLETEREIVEVSSPAVISVVPDIALPRICGMKDILAAGKKPVTTYSSTDLGVTVERGVEYSDVLAPEPVPRKHEIFDASNDGDLERFIAAIKESIV